MHLVIASRVDPDLPIARLRARSQLTEIRAADLRFTPDEAATFLNQVMGLNLPGDDMARLEQRTEGWIAGLQLAALSLQGRDAKGVAEAISDFGGSHRYVIDYLVEEVLRRQPEARREFLRQTAILDGLCAPLCDAVTRRNDGKALLAELEQANLFLVPLDDRREWYRYHRLFSDFLRAQLEPEQEASLHRQAAAWHTANGSAPEAIQHFLAAKDFESAAPLIESIARSMTQRGETATVQSWLDALPDDLVRARPRLCLARAWLALTLLQMTTIEPHVQAAEDALRSAGAETDRSLHGEVLAIRALLASAFGDVPGTIVLARQALDGLPAEEKLLRGLVALSLGNAYFGQSDLIEATPRLAEAAALLESAGNLSFELVARGALAAMYGEQGRLREAAELFRQALRKSERNGQPLPLTGVTIIYLGLCGVLHEWNQLDEALVYHQRGIDLCRQLSSFSGVLITLYVSLARVLRTRGDLAGALEYMKEAETLVRQLNYLSAIDQIETHLAQIWLAQGNVAAAVAWADRREPALPLGEEAILPPALEIDLLALARVRAAQGRFDDALKLTERVLRSAQAVGRARPVIEVHALHALVFQAQGQTASALNALEQALALAEPGGYIRPFLDEGEPMRELLARMKAAPRGGRMKKYIQQLLDAFGKPGAELHPSSLALQPLVEPLNERELEVLRLIAGGLSNREIADRLVVAVSTVKWHINNLYAKLDVRTRTQALARAKELGLLQ